MNDTLTPETNAAEFPCMTWPSRDHPMVVRSEVAKKLERERDKARQAWYEMQSSFERSRDEAEKLMRERNEAREQRDKWKAKYIQQNKDLGCEMMDPNGTIWDHAKNLQDQIRAMKKMILRIGYPARGSADESADLFAFASEITGTWSLEDLTSRNEP